MKISVEKKVKSEERRVKNGRNSEEIKVMSEEEESEE
jgi:hypothetical protein